MAPDPFAATDADAASTSVRMMASLDPVDTVLWFRGTVHSQEPGLPQEPLFDLEGYRITRAAVGPQGWELRSRVAAFYLHPGTDDRLTTVDALDVMHVWNDPVTLRVVTSSTPVRPYVVGDHVHLSMDGFFLGPNPLVPRRWPRESTGELLQGADLCRLIAPADELRTSRPSVSCALSMVRVSPWLPWMARGTQPGQLVYHLGGTKLPSWSALPAHVRRWVEAERPEFAFAPTGGGGPDETSWTRYATSKRPLPPR